MRRRNKFREYPPVIVALVLALAFFCFAIETIGSSAGYIETGAAQRAETETTAGPERETETPETAAPQTTQPPEAESQTLIGSVDWGGEDTDILLKIAMAEAEGEGVKGKALVMLVVLNRVWSDEFPGTIEEVVFQRGQFTPTAEGGRYWTTEPDEECYEALELIESGWDESRGALYFESCDGDTWHSRNLEKIFEYGNHKFYR